MKNGGGSGPKPVRLLEAGAQFAYDRNYKNLEGVAVAANIPADEAFECAPHLLTRGHGAPCLLLRARHVEARSVRSVEGAAARRSRCARREHRPH